MRENGVAIDRMTQAWVRATGRSIRFDEHPWLDGPVGSPTLIGDEWLQGEARRLDGELREGGGLFDSFDVLAGDDFDPSQLSPTIIDFYEHTTEWTVEVWSQWSAVALPAGWVLSALFSSRLQQLALPLRPLDVALGMVSRVSSVRRADGRQLGAAWLRTLRATGQVVYSGWYGAALLPGTHSPSVRVVFPLPNGSIMVFLRPSVGRDGELVLTSPLGSFGDDGAYLVVRTAENEGAVRRVPLAEQFRVYVDDKAKLRTDHALKLWSIPVLRFHYRLEREQPVKPPLF